MCPPGVANSGDYGGGGNRTRVTSKPETPVLQGKRGLDGRCYALEERSSGPLVRCDGDAVTRYGGQWYCPYHTKLVRNAVLAERQLALEPTVYFAQREGDRHIKIGVSRDPLGRCRTLKARLVATEPGGYSRESELHKLFHGFRRKGEWFTPAEPLLRHIRNLQVASREPDEDMAWLADAVAVRAGGADK